MKESPEPNYSIDVTIGGDEPIAGFNAHLPGSIVVLVNHVVNVIVVPWLAQEPWPPAYPSDWERVGDRDEASRYALATHSVTIAPSPDGVERSETVTFVENPDVTSTAIWLPRAEHSRLVEELKSDVFVRSPAPRLDDIHGTAVWEFLRHRLPRVGSLTDYDRRILCIPTLSPQEIEQ